MSIFGKNAQGISVSPVCPVGTTELIRKKTGIIWHLKGLNFFVQGMRGWGGRSPPTGRPSGRLIGGVWGAEPPRENKVLQCKV